MTQAQHALTPIGPVEGDVEVDPAFAAREAHLLLDPALDCIDAGMGDHIAGIRFLNSRIAPFQVGDLGLAWRFEYAVAGVPIGLEADVLESAVGDRAQDSVLTAFETHPFQGQSAA